MPVRQIPAFRCDRILRQSRPLADSGRPRGNAAIMTSRHGTGDDRGVEDADGAIEDGDLSHPDGIDFDVARKLEHEFLNGFEARLYTVPSVANPFGERQALRHPLGRRDHLVLLRSRRTQAAC